MGPRGSRTSRKTAGFDLLEIFFTPKKHEKNVFIVWVGLGGVGGAYLPFGSLDHARAIFFKFLVLKGIWHGGGTILKSV